MYLFSHSKHKQYSAGFTLVEMIVAVFLFTVVMLVSVGALMSVLDANRRAQATKAVMNNLHFALESMTREIRVGGSYSSNTSDSLDFIDKDGCGISYTLLDSDGDKKNEIVRSVAPKGECSKLESTNIPMTAPEVEISTLEFYVDGENQGAGDGQPRVLIIVRGVAGVTERTRVPFNLETFVVQRFLDR